MNRFQEHVEFVRRHSPYYRELYREVPSGCPEISRYPIVNQQTFWQANEDFGRGVLTADYKSGIVFKSGGTSGNPKYSFFTAREWDSFTAVSGWGFTHNGVKEGDRIANLFYAGELYASFIYVTDLVKSSDVGITFPISGQTPVETSVAMMKKLGINVLAGVPTTFMKIISYLQQHPELRPEIELILFGGEPFYEDQLRSIASTFPRARVHSILYASVDGGELGFFDAKSCENGEHRCFDQSTIMEIVEEDTLEVITEQNRPGKLLVTNLERRLMPLIRYPVGDVAMWTEPAGSPNRRFKLMGRSQEGARIGPATLYVQDVLAVIEHFHDQVSLLNFQLIITHHDKKDQALIRIVPETMPENKGELGEQMLAYLYQERSMLRDLVEQGLIHPLELQWCRPDELESNPRTGKTRRVLDRRLDG